MPSPRLLDEAETALWALLGAQALADRDGHLLPTAFGVGGGVVPVGQRTGVQLLLRPLPQGQHLRTERGLRRCPRCLLQRRHQLRRRDQGGLVLGAVAHLEQTGVVRAPFEDRVTRPAAGHRLDGVQRARDVLAGQLALQGQRRRGDHDPVHLAAGQPDQCRGQVAQRLARSRAGLGQQVHPGVEGVPDRRSQLQLTGTFVPSDLRHGDRQHLRGLLGGRRARVSGRGWHGRTGQLDAASSYGASSPARSGCTRAVTSEPCSVCSSSSSSRWCGSG